MVAFTLDMPRRISFGLGILAKLPSIAKALGRRILIVAGSRWFAGSGWKRRVEEMLGGLVFEHLTCGTGEPTTDSLAEARGRARAFGPDGILAIGGGSILDTAKALSALLALPARVEEYLEGVEGAREIPGPGVPWIAIPSTAGTGAEVTKNAVIKHTTLNVKRSMRSLHLLAREVLVDPELTMGLPLSVTGISGLDALTQLVEAYVSRGSTPLISGMVRNAFPLMLDALRGLPANPSSPELRSDASYGALVSGIALANAGLGAAHGFAAAIGGAYEIQHGLLCAVMLPHVLEANAPVITERIAELASGEADGRDPVEWLAETVRELLRAYGLPLDLKSFGIPRSMLSELAENSSGSSMRGNPRELSRQDKENLLSRVI
jgi:alcohol dehydrogenase class IV